MRSVKVHEAKTHFSKLLTAVEGGEEVVVKRGDVPVARIVPYREEQQARVAGRWRGKVRMAEDFGEIPSEFDEYLI